jgi:hypothetical protein
VADHAVNKTFLVTVAAFRIMFGILHVSFHPVLHNLSIRMLFPDHGDHLQSRVGGFECDLPVRQHVPVDA